MFEQNLRGIERQESPGDGPGVEEARRQSGAVARDDHHRVLARCGGDRTRGAGGEHVEELIRAVGLERRRQIQQAPDPVDAPLVQRTERHLGRVGAPPGRPRTSQADEIQNQRASQARVAEQRLQASVKRRVVQVLGDHHRRTGPLEHRPEALELLESRQHRLFDQEVLPGAQPRLDEVGVRARRHADHQRLVARAERLLVAAEAILGPELPAEGARTVRVAAGHGERNSGAHPLVEPDVAGVHGAASDEAKGDALH